MNVPCCPKRCRSGVVTFQISGFVGILWKDAPEVGDGGDCHGHHPLDED